MRFDVRNSNILNELQKELILQKLASRITADGVLMVVAQEKRSQGQNKEEALDKLDVLLVKAFAKKKVRKPTKPSKAAKLRRIESKKRTSEKKQWRSHVR